MTHRFPPHVQNFFNNLKEIEELSRIHRTVAGSTPGRKSKVHTLNKSAIVLLTACWEYYIEDLLRESFSFMLKESKSHKSFPISVLVKASNDLKNHKDERRVWELAGKGWRKVLSNFQKSTLEKEIDHFHVPRPENIDQLYLKLLGIEDVTKNILWQKMSNQNALETLNYFIDLRGEIAHNVKTKSSVRKKDVDDYRKFLNRAAVILHNRVTKHVEKAVKKAPWSTYLYGSVH